MRCITYKPSIESLGPDAPGEAVSVEPASLERPRLRRLQDLPRPSRRARRAPSGMHLWARDNSNDRPIEGWRRAGGINKKKETIRFYEHSRSMVKLAIQGHKGSRRWHGPVGNGWLRCIVRSLRSTEYGACMYKYGVPYIVVLVYS